MPSSASHDATPVTKMTQAVRNKFEALEKDVDNIREDVEECKDVQAQMKVLDERTQVILSKATKNETAIFGNNGNVGMKERLAKVEASIIEIKQDIGSFKKLGYGAIATAIGIFIELLIQLILSHGTALVK